MLPLLIMAGKLFYSASGMIGCLGLAKVLLTPTPTALQCTVTHCNPNPKGELLWEADIFFTKNLHYEQSCIASSQVSIITIYGQDS